MEFELPLIFFLLLPFLLSCSGMSDYGEFIEATVSTSVVKYLPGFEGTLPFYLETGYVGVGASNQDQLFYYFVESENKPGEDPLVLWLTGGPGCSALSSIAYGIGPWSFKNMEFHGGIPPLELNPYSLTKVASVIFLDQPVGAGFSYSEGKRDELTGDVDTTNISVDFLRKWLASHPRFVPNPIYIGGDSYAGKIVPALALQIATGIDNGEEPQINLQGYLMGNPTMDEKTDYDSRVPFAHGMALISDELYKSAKENCKGAYTEAPNRECKDDLDAIEKLLSGIHQPHILENFCPFASPKSYSPLRDRSLKEEDLQLYHPPVPLPAYGCRSYLYLLAYYWANNNIVRHALGIRKRSVKEWIRCPTLNYSKDISSTIGYHKNLAARGYRSLVYSGDHDYVIPYMGTEAWIKSLNYSILDDWRPWFIDNQVAGYTRTYSNNMTFATVKGGGHTAPEYKPAECLAMFGSGSPTRRCSTSICNLGANQYKIQISIYLYLHKYIEFKTFNLVLAHVFKLFYKITLSFLLMKLLLFY